ncbi:MAG: S41 family peptidase [bacterium]|nr:S41 family peptidase [bacterium]
MEQPKRLRTSYVAFTLIAAVFFYAGYYTAKELAPTPVVGIDNITEGQAANVDFAPFWKAWNLINEKYVPASTTAETVTNQEKVYGAIKGLAESLDDPYTVFFPPVEARLFESDIRGNFEGVGMEIVAQDGAITVIAPLKGSPAERAGILTGDKILRVNDKDVTNISTDEAVQLIRGPKGSPVTFTIFRTARKEPFTVSVIRDVIDIPTIGAKQLDGGVFLIELYNFSANSPNLFRNALRQFIESDSDKMILDLRGNPGGFLEAAIDMASWYLPAGKAVVKEDFGGARSEKVYRSKGYDIFTDNLKFVILVDQGSASASEILAGALSEHDKAILVGDKTFGKGSVQELINITPDTSLKVTVARWLTPSGKSISEEGITPDILIKRTAEDVSASRDPQLQKAIEILTQ